MIRKQSLIIESSPLQFTKCIIKHVRSLLPPSKTWEGLYILNYRSDLFRNQLRFFTLHKSINFRCKFRATQSVDVNYILNERVSIGERTYKQKLALQSSRTKRRSHIFGHQKQDWDNFKWFNLLYLWIKLVPFHHVNPSLFRQNLVRVRSLIKNDVKMTPLLWLQESILISYETSPTI